ncbi:MAG: TM0106 family RecB-like putative nuclease [Parcubacteria group bacterium]|nr:TM0106 family RecB-like putative nuclease [Parcubacteria group bacterium]
MSKQLLKSEHFYKFFLCPHWIWYDIYEDQKKHKHVPPVLEMLYSGKIREPQGVLPAKEFVEIKQELYNDLDEAFLATVELMKQGKNVYKPVLMDGHWVGEPDFIERRPIAELKAIDSSAKSNFGDWYYVAYDIRNDPELKDEYKFPLVFASLILEKIQGAKPQDAYIINADGEARSFLIEPFLDKFQLTLKEIEKVLEGEKPPPFIKGGCKRSPWFSICEEETKGCEDISLIHGISQRDQRDFYEMGIKTVGQLAESDLNRLQEGLEGWNYDKLIRVRNQAEVLVSGRFLAIQSYNFPEVENEIYFDVESDPTRGIDFLFGLLVKKQNRKTSGGASFKYFLAKGKEDEKKMWEDFLEFLSKLENFVIYHYGYYEKHVLSRLEKRYGAPSDLMKKFRENSLDLYNIATSSVVLPIYFYSLKDVAGFIGYKWTDEGAGGGEAVIWYDQWLETGNKKFLNKLIKYNEDDVRATALIKEWLEKQRPRIQKETLDSE